MPYLSNVSPPRSRATPRPPASLKRRADLLNDRVSKMVHDADRRNDDPTNNVYTFNANDKKALAKKIDVILRQIESNAKKVDRIAHANHQPPGRVRRTVTAVAEVASFLYMVHQLSVGLSTVGYVAASVVPASSAVWRKLKALRKIVEPYVKSGGAAPKLLALAPSANATRRGGAAQKLLALAPSANATRRGGAFVSALKSRATAGSKYFGNPRGWKAAAYYVAKNDRNGKF